jgi:hypothetical protein
MSCLPYDGCGAAIKLLLALVVIFSIIIIYLYYTLVLHQYGELTVLDDIDKKIKHTEETYMKILSLRMALLVPLFSIIAIISYVDPSSIPVMEFFEALIEGYCILSFYKMLFITLPTVTGKSTLSIYKDTNHAGLFDTCHKNNTECCKNTVTILLYQFFLIRPILVLIASIGELNHDEGMYQAFTALQIISLISAMIALLRAYHITIEYSAPEHYLTRKVIFIKAIIIVFAIQNIIVNNNFGGNSGTIEYRRRILAFIVSGELLILSFFFAPIFIIKARPIIISSTNPSSTRISINSNNNKNNKTPVNSAAVLLGNGTIKDFFLTVFSFHTLIFARTESLVGLVQPPVRSEDGNEL